MPEWIRVVPQDLHVSAASVGTHADELQARHTAADGRIQAAQAGVPAAAGVALSAAMPNGGWTRMFSSPAWSITGKHWGTAAAYLHTEEGNALNLDSLGGEAASVVSGL